MPQHYPIIGLPTRSDTSGSYRGSQIDAQNSSYSRALIAYGGIPILIPVSVTGQMLDTLFDRVDALLFTGGGDIAPRFYNQSPLVENLSDVQPERDAQEIALVNLAIERQKPFFAICRGIQVLNVAAGGELWQDLETQNSKVARHDFYYQDDRLPRNYIAHDVKLSEASLLRRVLNTDTLPVNSLHHQAIKTVASSLKIAGQAADGVVEVLEVPDHPFGVGVQWHPEELFAEQAESRALFNAFVTAARNGHR
jgi:putative glutamine amidotransferase